MMRIVIIAIKSNAISQSPQQRYMLDFMNILSSFINVQNIEVFNIVLYILRNTHLCSSKLEHCQKYIKKKFQTKAFNET